MGQYYMPIVLKKNWKNLSKKENVVDATLDSWAFGNGLKLMEHSYVHNNFVEAMMFVINKVGRGEAVPVVWCGDYADKVETKAFPFTDEKDQYGDPEGGVNLFNSASKWLEYNADKVDFLKDEIEKSKASERRFKYIVNETTKTFVKVPQYKKERWTYHPLPILCAYGNGRGGGDYYRKGENGDLVGSWAFHEIRLTNKKPEGYEQLDWVEEYDE